MMKDNTESLSELFLPLENRMKALEEAGIGGAELKKVQDETAKKILGRTVIPVFDMSVTLHVS